MRKLLAVLGLLLGATVVAPIGASAAIQSPGLHVTALRVTIADTAFARRGTAQGGYLLVDDDDDSSGGGGGGGGGDDDNSGGGGGGYGNGGGGGGNDRDDDDDRPRGGGGFPRGGGGVNLNGLGNVLNGIGRIIENGRRNQPQQRIYPQRNDYNEQAERQRLQRQMQKKAADDQKKQRRAAEKKARDQRRKEQQREETQRLNRERRDNDNRPPYQQPTPVPVDPTPQPVPVINDPNPVPPEDNCPDNFQQLRVGSTILSPYRTDYPADPRVCTGTTSRGCYLRVMNGPAACGNKPTCVMHCPPNVPIIVPKPIVVPPPVDRACAYPPCGPQPQPVPLPVPPPKPLPQPVCATPDCSPPPPVDRACAYPPCAPVPQPVCTNPPCGPDPRKEDPTAPEWTIRADPKVEPQPKPTPADKTIIADPKAEPKPPATKPDPTIIAQPKIEPKPPATKPDPTITAQPKTEPKPPATKPDPTVTAQPKTEPKPAATKPDPTVIAQSKTEPEHPKTPPEKTVIADPKREPEQPKTLPQKTVLANPKVEPDRPKTPPEQTIIPVSLVEPDHPNTPQKTVIPAPQVEPAPKRPISPVPNKQTRLEVPTDKKPPPIAAPPKDKPEFGFDDATPFRPNTTVDGKGCAPTGAVGVPVANFKNDPQYARKVLAGVMGAVPEAGAGLKQLVEFLWKDNGPSSLFNQVKDYVDKLVPELITQDRLTEMENRLKGIKDNLDNYNAMSGSEKGPDLLVTLGAITTHSQDFLADNGVNRAAPDRTLTYFVEFGLLKLAVLKERLQRDKELFPETDPQKYAHDHAEREKQLYDAVRLLVKRAGEVKAALVKKRLEKLQPANHDTYWSPRFGGHGTTHYYAAKDDFCGWRGPDHEEDEKAARDELEKRKKEVEQTYSAAVDAILDPITNWASVLPEEIERKRQEAELARLKNERTQKEVAEFLRRQQEYRANAKPIEGCSYCEAHGIFGID